MAGGARKGILTVRGLAAMNPGEWAADPAARGAGRLQVRKLGGGELAFYYRYTTPSGDRDRLPLGTGLSLTDAREKAAALSRRYQDGDRSLREALDAEFREAERMRMAAEAAEAAAAVAAAATLGRLLEAYVADLYRAGKSSARSVERSLRLHVEQAWPQLWSTPASAVTADDLLAPVARLAEQDKLREAAKLRSYFQAAFSSAIRARRNARALPALRDLNILQNPARDLVTIDGASAARERALSVPELRSYWRRIRDLADPDGALLRFHVLTGGQRVEQLTRVTLDDFDEHASVVRLRDSKGRRRKARIHDVPLVPEALDALRAMEGGAYGPYAFTVSGGLSGATYAMVRGRLETVVDAMQEAGELERGRFTVGDIRRTIETRLAAAGVSKEIRGQLQSHGLGGVQDRHYDRHDYLAEKLAALETLRRVLTGTTAKVTPIRKKAGRRR